MLFRSAAQEVELELPVCRTVAALEEELMAAGHGEEDVSALARWFMGRGAPAANDAAGAS